MEINNDGTVGIDLAEIGRRLDAVGSITDEKRQRHAVHKLQTEIFLDVAVSLRVLAEEAGRAMAQTNYFTQSIDVPEDGGELDLEAPFRLGDLVRVKGTDHVGTIEKLGVDQGDEYANVYYESMGNTGVERYYTRNLERLVGDEKPHVSTETEDAAMIDADDAPELFVGDGPEEEDRDVIAASKALAGDIDSDFDGYLHPEADDALAALAAKEAERKAGAKKKGSKK